MQLPAGGTAWAGSMTWNAAHSTLVAHGTTQQRTHLTGCYLVLSKAPPYDTAPTTVRGQSSAVHTCSYPPGRAAMSCRQPSRPAPALQPRYDAQIWPTLIHTHPPDGTAMSCWQASPPAPAHHPRRQLLPHAVDQCTRASAAKAEMYSTMSSFKCY